MKQVYSSNHLGRAKDNVSIYETNSCMLYLVGNASKGKVRFFTYGKDEKFGNSKFWGQHRNDLKEYNGLCRSKKSIALDLEFTFSL